MLLANNEYEMELLNGVLCGGMRLVNARRIVATTNPKLWFMGGGRTVGGTWKPYGGTNKIGEDFVQAYTKAQGAIKEVMLEYETVEDTSKSYGEHGQPALDILKLRNNGRNLLRIGYMSYTDSLS